MSTRREATGACRGKAGGTAVAHTSTTLERACGLLCLIACACTDLDAAQAPCRTNGNCPQDQVCDGDSGECVSEGDAGIGVASQGDAGEGDAGEGDAGEGDAGEGNAGEGNGNAAGDGGEPATVDAARDESENSPPGAGEPTLDCGEGFEPDGSGGCRDIDECAAGLDDCSDAPDACINRSPQAGRYQCQCPAGYEGSGIGSAGCANIDECALGSHTCDRDPIVTCTDTEGDFSCGPCPSGFDGDAKTGEQGCVPLLNNLSAGAATLVPAFDASVTAYDLAVWEPELTLAASANSGHALFIDGAAASSGVGETISLELGSQVVEVVVTAGGASRSYSLTIERHPCPDTWYDATDPDGSPPSNCLLTAVQLDNDVDGMVDATERYAHDSMGRVTQTLFDTDADGLTDQIVSLSHPGTDTEIADWDFDADGTVDMRITTVRDAMGRPLTVESDFGVDLVVDERRSFSYPTATRVDEYVEECDINGCTFVSSSTTEITPPVVTRRWQCDGTQSVQIVETDSDASGSVDSVTEWTYNESGVPLQALTRSSPGGPATQHKTLTHSCE